MRWDLTVACVVASAFLVTPGFRQYVVAVDAYTGKPNPLARRNNGTPALGCTGAEIAHWLFWQKKTMGRLSAAARTKSSR